VEANVAPDQAVVSSRAARGIRILLVWGVRFTGECLAELLERDPSMSVVGLCADLSEAVALSASMQPDIVLLDGRMPEGAAAARRALDEAPGMRIVVSSVRETEDDVVAWAEAGVIGYIPRTTPLCDFVRLMMEIHSGLSDKEIARRLNISVATTKSHVHNLLGKLNARRRTEIADYLRG
jgi:DNA-binding NarL/FixJ family response regulator